MPAFVLLPQAGVMSGTGPLADVFEFDLDFPARSRAHATRIQTRLEHLARAPVLLASARE